MFQPNIKQQIKQQSILGQAIIPYLIGRYHPQSVADFGCGVGEFLRMFAKAINTDNYIGIDSYYYKYNDRSIPEANFMVIDFNKEQLFIQNPYDIHISIEVIEHIDSFMSFEFLRYLTTAKKAILFSGATPGQGGKGHVNEQKHSYWHYKFREHGFRTMDIIRPIIRGVMGIPDYYKNNIFVYERI